MVGIMGQFYNTKCAGNRVHLSKSRKRILAEELARHIERVVN